MKPGYQKIGLLACPYTSLHPNGIWTHSLVHEKGHQPPKQPNNPTLPNIKQANPTVLFTRVLHTGRTFLLICIVLSLPFITECYLGLLEASSYLHHHRPITSSYNQVCDNNRLCRSAHLHKYLHVQTLLLLISKGWYAKIYSSPTDAFRKHATWTNAFILKWWWRESRIRSLTLPPAYHTKITMITMCNVTNKKR